MKTSLAPGNRKPPTALELAQAGLTSNIAIPGLGSIVSGQKIGYFQIILCLSGMGLTMVFGLRLIFFILAHWGLVYHPDNIDDPFAGLRLMWPNLRWALLGMLLFGISWLWALQTSLGILRKAKQKPAAP